MKILIATGIFPPNIGGPATQIEHLASDLAEKGFQVTVLTFGAPEKKEKNFKVFAVSRRWPPFLRNLIFAAKTFYLARRFDIIYAMDLYAPGFSSMLAAKFWRKKLVIRFAGDSAWESAQNLGKIKDDILSFQDRTYDAFIEKRKRQRTRILKSADAVVAVSNFMKDLAVKIGVSSEKVNVIYNAVDFFGERPIHKKPPCPTLVFSGRMTPWKGIEMLIRIVAKLKQTYPEIIFEILGDGPEFEKLLNLASALRVEKNINFHGKISESETHDIFAHSTIFVLNTNYEGLSHAILNAMSVGVPVITTPVGGNSELIKDGENGFLVPYNNEELWMFAIKKLLADENLQEKFSNNGKKAAEKFKWNDLMEKTSALFCELGAPK